MKINQYPVERVSLRKSKAMNLKRIPSFLILVFTLVSAAVLFSGYISYNLNQDDVGGYLQRWNVSINAVGMQLTDFSESHSGGLTKETLEAKGRDMVLKMTKVDTNAPKKYIDDKKFLLESLFLPTTSPYPGVITNVRECPEEFKPKVREKEQGIIYTLFAGARFNYGVCAKDLVEYYSLYGIFDCGEKGIFEVRLFSKQEENPGTLVGSFRCE